MEVNVMSDPEGTWTGLDAEDIDPD